MKIRFNIHYHTEWGESVYVVGNHVELGNGDIGQALKLTFTGEDMWSGETDIANLPPDLSYSYVVIRDDGSKRLEYGLHKLPNVDPHTTLLELYDRWQLLPADKPFYSSAFTECIFKREPSDSSAYIAKGSLCIRTSAPQIRANQLLAITGSINELGNWDTRKAVVMNNHNFPEWEVAIPLNDANATFEYKFLIIDRCTREVVAWERGSNHQFEYRPKASNETMVVSGIPFQNPLQLWRGAGVAIPVFSLRSDDDFGCGDFYDLMKMAEWCHKTGQRFIQILPINDTTMTHTWTDSYPYNANSTFALHPMYLRLSAMGTLDDPSRQRHYDEMAKELNALSDIDYERVTAGKNDFTKELFEQEYHSIANDGEFQKFVAENAEWLTPYAAFCLLRDKFGTPDMSKWGEYAIYDEHRVSRFVKEHQHDINYVYFIQYHLDKQMRHVLDYTHKLGVAIKGDIPIGISRTSVDAWMWPHLFNMDCSAGAPPDDFSLLGQNWGFPTYNWEQMSLDGFAWWKARLRKMSEYFDAYRIDHVLGFFRIWQIPLDAIHGLLGIFNPALPFTPEELEHDYNFRFDIATQTTPYIKGWVIDDVFGDYADEAKETFMTLNGDDSYKLKATFETQKKVAAHFDALPHDEMNDTLRHGLLKLIDDVLFIEDPYQKGKYHPRISAKQTYAYQSLSDYEKWSYTRLYNDFYYHRNNDFWREKAMWKLPPLIDATNMLACAEDLGMIPDCVPSVLDELKILSLEIQRMPKESDREFGDTWNYPYYSVCTTSTHDMPGIRQWWEDDPSKAERYHRTMMDERGTAPLYAEARICDSIVTSHLSSPAMLCILPLQDWLSLDNAIRRKNAREEQINEPSNPRHYWRYRMHLTLERLLQEDELNAYINKKITECGR